MSDYKTVQQLKEIDVNIAALFRSILILRRKTTKTAKNGNPFLSVELGDGSGSFTANCFDGTDIYTCYRCRA
jgi:3'-5' exoribonuclease